MKCSFCQNEIRKGTGKQLIKDDGKVLNFCKGKCEKNMLGLGRRGRTTAWTVEAHNLKKGTKK